MSLTKKAVSLVSCAILIFIFASCLSGEEAPDRSSARSPAVAGTFYPGDPKELRQMIEGYLSESPLPMVPGRPIAIIAPHAGYIYSGKTAAAGFKALEGMTFDTVIVIGPSHRFSFDGAAIYADGPYRTPLGDVPIDDALIEKIVTIGERITKNPVPHIPEHSVEVEIPFLQVVLGDFKLVPIVMGGRSLADCTELARAIAESVGDKRVLIVASSDLSHYHPRDDARNLDRVFRKFLENNDPDGLYDAMVVGKTEACGGGPVVAALMAAKGLGSSGVVVTKYDDSGTETGTTDAVVGYISAVVYGRGTPPAGEGETFSAADKKKLLTVARKSIECGLSGKDLPDFGIDSPALTAIGAAFVTLTKDGQLRGCIGFPEPVYPLWETVALAASGAAFRDPRFYPVMKSELADIEIEISVLSALMPIASADEIIVGTHGVVIRRGARGALFLPQVPVEQGWTRDEYLENLCLKAGLLPEDWKEKDAQLFIFTADVFSEK